MLTVTVGAIFRCTQSALLVDTSCPSGTVRSFQSGAATLPWTIHQLTTRWFALLGHTLESLRRSRPLLTISAGLTFYWSRMMCLSAGTERSLSKRCSATTKTTHSHGLDSVLRQQTNNWMIFCSKYDHAQEVIVALFHKITFGWHNLHTTSEAIMSILQEIRSVERSLERYFACLKSISTDDFFVPCMYNCTVANVGVPQWWFQWLKSCLKSC